MYTVTIDIGIVIYYNFSHIFSLIAHFLTAYPVAQKLTRFNLVLLGLEKININLNLIFFLLEYNRSCFPIAIYIHT